ncbi:MAG: response regulator [Spirochaetes bacterium]|nr:response regulator [Spirochaetota bacterium]
MKKILIVDDKKDNITSLKFLLEELSDRYQIITATSGAEALNKIEQILPDAILLDIKMPIMDGYEVCRRIRNNNSLSYIPIIFLTAHDLDIQSVLMII